MGKQDVIELTEEDKGELEKAVIQAKVKVTGLTFAALATENDGPVELTEEQLNEIRVDLVL